MLLVKKKKKKQCCEGSEKTRKVVLTSPVPPPWLEVQHHGQLPAPARPGRPNKAADVSTTPGGFRWLQRTGQERLSLDSKLDSTGSSPGPSYPCWQKMDLFYQKVDSVSWMFFLIQADDVTVDDGRQPIAPPSPCCSTTLPEAEWKSARNSLGASKTSSRSATWVHDSQPRKDPSCFNHAVVFVLVFFFLIPSTN